MKKGDLILDLLESRNNLEKIRTTVIRNGLSYNHVSNINYLIDDINKLIDDYI